MSELVLITNWVSTFIQSKFGLDGVALQIINSFVIKFLALSERIVRNANIEKQIMNANAEYILNSIYKLVILSSLCYIGYLAYKHWETLVNYWNIYVTGATTENTPKIEMVTIQAPGSNDTSVPRVYYKTDITNIQSLITTITRFMQLHPEFFQTNINKRIINYNGAENYYIYEDPVIFDDKIHNTFGYLTTSYKEIGMGDKIKKTFTIILFIDKESKNAKCYTKLLEEYVEHELKHGNRVKLNYYKILNRQLITHTFYDKSISEWFSDVDRLKQEFFLTQAKYLFSIFDKKNTSNANTAWNNLIIHGRPGTGKSAFIYRLATQMKMNIVSVDLSMYINKKKELYSLFHGQECTLPIGEEKYNIGKNSIIVLEEFNGAIDNIMKVENILKYKDQIAKEYFERKNSELEQKLEKNEREFGETSQSRRGSNKKSHEKMNYMEYATDSINSQRKRDVDLSTVTMELESIIKKISDDNQSDILRLNDLLELFQGPIPIKDRIIIATTNHYQRIKEYLPALFRPGRLTSLEFKYLDWYTFCELCKYYYKKQPPIESKCEICIPTSQIIEIAVKHQAMKSTFEEFLNDIFEIINQKNIEIEEKLRIERELAEKKRVQLEIQRIADEEKQRMLEDKYVHDREIIELQSDIKFFESKKCEELEESEVKKLFDELIDSKYEQIIEQYADTDLDNLSEKEQEIVIAARYKQKGIRCQQKLEQMCEDFDDQAYLREQLGLSKSDLYIQPPIKPPTIAKNNSVNSNQEIKRLGLLTENLKLDGINLQDNNDEYITSVRSRFDNLQNRSSFASNDDGSISTNEYKTAVERRINNLQTFTYADIPNTQLSDLSDTNLSNICSPNMPIVSSGNEYY